MQVIQYKDHIAYQFENSEMIFAVAKRVLGKLKVENVMNGLEVTYNGKPRIIYETQGQQPLVGMLQTMDGRSAYRILMQFLRLILRFEENDFLQKEVIDVNIYHIFYDVENETIKCCALPIDGECDYHEKTGWQGKYRQTLATLLKICFKDAPHGYRELYNQIFDGRKTDTEIVEYLLDCNYQWYGLGSSITGKEYNENKLTKPAENVAVEKPILELEYASDHGNEKITVMNEPFTVGSLKGTADARIAIGALSRQHCTIKKTNGILSIIDNNSTNGSYMNGVRLKPEVAYVMKDGDILRLADIEFKIKING